jgi:hypothetical protein
MKNYLGREDTLNSIVGGAAVGAVLGLKTNSGANALKYGFLFAGAWEIRCHEHSACIQPSFGLP